MSSLTVLVATCLRPQMVERLLENLTHQTRPPDEILFVDSSPDENTKTIVEAWQKHYTPRTNLRWMTSKRGLTFQRNVGIDNTDCDLICMLDDDIVLEPECLTAAEAFLDSEEGQEYGGIGAYITNEYGKDLYGYQRLYHRLGIYENLEAGRWLYCGAFLQLSTLKPFEGIYRSDFIPAGASVYRRKVLLEFRPDPSFGFEAEDKHLSLRVSQVYSVGVLGHARLRHDHIAGGARRSRFFQAIDNLRNHAIILVDCDPHLTWRRYAAFVLYQWLDLTRQTALIVFRPKTWSRFSFLGIAGLWVAWWKNLIMPPRRKAIYK